MSQHPLLLRLGKEALSRMAGENAKGPTPGKRIRQQLAKLHMHLPLSTAILLEIHTKDTWQNYEKIHIQL